MNANARKLSRVIPRLLGLAAVLLIAAPPRAGAQQAIGGLRIERTGHTATRLPGGKILVVGGENANGPVRDSEVFDPASKTFSAATGLLTARADHTATSLADGRLFVIGGRASNQILNSTEIYDPETHVFSSGPALNRPRAGHTATLLPDGRIVVVGGDADGSVEVFDPSAGAFRLIEARLAVARKFHAAALLQDGVLLIVGGSGSNGTALNSGELLDTVSFNFFHASPSMRVARSRPTLRMLPDGKVQVIGGDADSTMELFNSDARYFSSLVHPAGNPSLLAAALKTQTRAVAIGHPAPKKFLVLDGDDIAAAQEELLDRTRYSLTEIPELNQALAAGGARTSGQLKATSALFSSSAATVTTDQTDYSPGQTVIITGTGWLPGETVTLNIHRDTNEPPDTVLTAVADASGDIRNSDYVVLQSDLGVTFLLTATGQTSGFTAQTAFTDGALKIRTPSPIWPGSTSPNKFGVTVQPFTGSTNCTTGAGTVSSGTADTNGFNTGAIGSGDSWLITANLLADAPNASFVFSNWTTPTNPVPVFATGFSGATRTTCIVGFPNASRDLVGNYVPNVAPVALNDTYSTNEDVALVVAAPGVLTNDTDSNNGQTLTAVRPAGSTGPTHGTLTLNMDGSFTYTPTVNFNGIDSFTYKANDGTADSTAFATVTITVVPVNDTPTADNKTVTTNEDTAAAVTLSGSDLETASENLTFTVTDPPAHGALSGTGASLTYTPASNYNGPDTFKYTVTDRGDPDNCGTPGPACAAAATSAKATVSITVSPVNDAPVATDGTATTNEDTAVVIDLGSFVSDVETADANLTYVIDSSPSHGGLSGAGQNRTYTPTANYNGTDTFTYHVTDRGDPDNCGTPSATCTASLSSAVKTVTITISPVNDKPTADNKTVTTNEDTAGSVTLTGSDVETAPANFTWTITVPPAHGTLSGTAPNVTYTPAANYNGPDSFQYTVTDRGDPDACGAPSATCSAVLTSDPATVTITVNPINDAPVATDGTATTNEDTAAIVDLGAFASDIETADANLTYTIDAGPSHGTLTGTGQSRTYTPAANFNGTDTFTYHVTDRGDPDNCGAITLTCSATLSSAVKTITITVVPVNDTPTADSKTVSTPEDTATSVTLSGSDVETAPAFFTWTITVPPAHGVLTGTAPNLTYSPNANYNGPDSFKYTVTDRGDPDACGTPSSTCAAAQTSAAATVSITVTPVNDKPTADNQAVTVGEDTPTPVTLTGSDVESTSANFAWTVTVSPTHGTLSGTAPNLTYTPTANYNGTDSFQFTVTDRGDPDACGSPTTACSAILTSDAATVSITVIPVNDKPVADDKSVTTPEDTPALVTLTGSDVETAPADFTWMVTVSPTHGVLTGTAPNLTYSPNANYNGPDSFKYTVTDRGDPDNCGAPTSSCLAALTSDPATVTITVSPVNDAPVATDGSETMNEDTTLTTIDLGALVSDVETANADLTYVIDAGPTHGTLSGSGQTRSYTPNANYNGTDSFTYHVTDRGDPDNCGAITPSCSGILSSSIKTVTITIYPINDMPTADNKTVTTNEDTAGSVILTGSDVETAPANFTWTITVPPAHGTLSGTAPNVTYTPAANYNGPDSFKYTVTDRGDPDNCSPTSLFCSGALVSSPATVSITVYPVNDAPVATDGTATTNEDTAAIVDLGAFASDIETADADLAYTIDAGPSHGTLTGTGQSRTYTPAANFNGTDTFTYHVTDRGDPDNCGAITLTCSAALSSAVKTITITVVPVNDTPTADSKSATTAEDTAVAITLSGSDTETTPANLTFTVTDLPAHGVLTGTGSNLTYTPAANYNGPDSFQYTVTDRGDPDNCGAPSANCTATQTSAKATVSITVNPVNDKPTADNKTLTTNEDTAGSVTLTGSDVETSSANFTWAITILPAHGTLSGTAPNLTYTPAVNYNGPDSFQYTVTDRGDPDNCGPVSVSCSGALTSDPATVSITVSPVNDAPAADNKSATTAEDTAVAITLSGSDTETTPANLSFTVTDPPANGTLSGTAPNLTYTPNANYNGPDSFQYTVTDRGDPDNCGAPGASCAAAATSAKATVSITVTPVNDAPSDNGDSYSTNEDTTLTVGAPGVLSNDTDVENNTLTATLVSGPGHATSFTLNPDGSFSYTPALNYNGPDSFTYKSCDNGTTGSPSVADPKCGAVVTVSITVIPVNDAPANVTASASPGAISENQSTTVSGTFTDPDIGDTHTVTINWGGSEGITTLNLAAGVFSYSASHQYLDDNPTGTGSDVYAITVTVTDNGSPQGSANASTSVTVSNVAPVATTVTGPAAPQPLGTSSTVTANFTDAGTQDTHTCTFSWDDGSPDTTVTAAGTGSGSCSATHTYAVPGVNTVRVTVKDDDTGTSNVAIFEFVVIYDPSAGFVTGGGWINQPATGAYPALPGKANFGFVSKYKKGSTVPEGETEFQFKAGDINFHSSAYDAGSLVISGGRKATYRGDGTVNGQPGYRFVLIAYDGDQPGGDGVDKFRIKITQGGTLIYDNRNGVTEDVDNADPTALGGGSIVIHK